jgi:galactokinase
MILFARANKGTFYDPKNRSIEYIPLGEGADDFRVTVMDTGTVRPGLEKSTYKVRRQECEEMVKLLKDNGYDINCLADIKDNQLYDKIIKQFGKQYPNLCKRITYICNAQKRFDKMLDAWRKGDVKTVGQIFRQDGIGLRDVYEISGPELETMCDIVRTVPGVLGERMLGGGDKGAAGALVKAEAAEAVVKAIETGYPRSRPDFADKYAVHTCKLVDGVKVFDNLL